MRLPWPFRRSQPPPSAFPDGTSGNGAGAGRVGTDGAWRRLPPLAGTIGPPPLVAPSEPFAATLASSEPPAPILAPLSHGRSLEAPRGLVVGVARPTRPAPGQPLLPPLQRSPRADRDAPGGTVALTDLPEADGPEASVARASAAGGAAPPLPLARDTGPIRRLAVADPAPVTSSHVLTRAPEPERPAQVVGLVGQPRAPGRAVTRSAEVEPALPPVQRSPIGGPNPETQVTSSDARARPAGPRLTIGQARRLGLGAPIASGPSGPASSGPAPSSAPPVVSPPSATPAGVPPEPTDLPLATRPPAVRTDHRADTEAEQGLPASPPPAMTAAMPATAAGTASRSPASPLTSAKRLGGGLQRAPLTLPTRAAGAAQGADTHPATGSSTPAAASAGGVKIHRGSAASDLASALDARSFTHGGEIYLPDSQGPLTSGKGRALLAHEMTHVRQQRRLGGSLPLEHTAGGRALEAEAVAAERAPDMPLATSPTSGSALALSSSAGPVPASPSESITSGSTVATNVSQRSPRGRTEGGTTARGDRSRQTHGPSEQELEILAHQLYQRIGRHLRRELLVDRERAGFGLDRP